MTKSFRFSLVILLSEKSLKNVLQTWIFYQWSYRSNLPPPPTSTQLGVAKSSWDFFCTTPFFRPQPKVVAGQGCFLHRPSWALTMTYIGWYRNFGLKGKKLWQKKISALLKIKKGTTMFFSPYSKCSQLNGIGCFFIILSSFT